MDYEIKQFTEEEIRHFQIACNMCGIGLTDFQTEIVMHTIEAKKIMGLGLDLETASKIRVYMSEKHDKQTKD